MVTEVVQGEVSFLDGGRYLKEPLFRALRGVRTPDPRERQEPRCFPWLAHVLWLTGVHLRVPHTFM